MEENIDQSRWLIGSSEMAERIHAHDWAATPLGPVTGWSSRLKLMVEQVLANPLVSSLVCGPENLLIYNDAAARLYGSRHPAALGQPLPQIFPEGWVTVAKFYERVFAGESVQVIAQPLDTRGEATLATDIFDAVLTPVREDDGRVAYVHMVGSRVRAEVMLRESEERFRALTQGLPQLVWAADEGGLWTWASDQWADYTVRARQTITNWDGSMLFIQMTVQGLCRDGRRRTELVALTSSTAYAGRWMVPIVGTKPAHCL